MSLLWRRWPCCADSIQDDPINRYWQTKGLTWRLSVHPSFHPLLTSPHSQWLCLYVLLLVTLRLVLCLYSAQPPSLHASGCRARLLITQTQPYATLHPLVLCEWVPRPWVYQWIAPFDLGSKEMTFQIQYATFIEFTCTIFDILKYIFFVWFCWDNFICASVCGLFEISERETWAENC